VLTNHAYWALQGVPDKDCSGGGGGGSGGGGDVDDDAPARLAEGAATGLELQLSCSRLLPLRESDWLPARGGATLPVAEASGAGGAGERGAPGALDFRAPALLRDKLAALDGGGSGGGVGDLRRGFNAYLLIDGWRPPASLHPLVDDVGAGAGAGGGDAASPHSAALEARLLPVARVRDPASGRTMRVASTAPGVML